MSSTNVRQKIGLGLMTTAACLAWAAGPGFARPPLSASDWLSGSIQQPGTVSAWRPGEPRPKELQRKSRQQIAPSGAVEPVGVTRLGQGNPDSKGTVSPRTAGLPDTLWGDSDGMVLAQQVLASNPRLPMLRRLERRLLAAQLQPPKAAPGTEGALFLARVDKLLDMGATGAAKELLLTAGPADPQRFRRLFDIALLSGDEAEACAIMDRTPGVAPSFPARIFCLAMGGDWAAAALVFHGADGLGQIDPQMATLLAHYLDDGFSDSSEMLPPPSVVTPLDLRLHEAIGQPLPSSNLPLAFALADLDQNGGWKARLDAAERLARAGAIPSSRLREIYVEQKPAASGGVWDRAAAIQTLVNALSTRDRAGIEAALPPAFDLMVAAGLGPALADMVGAEIGAMSLPGRAGQIGLWLALQSGQWQVVSEPSADAQPFDLWLLDFASGLADARPPSGNGADRASVLLQAFRADTPLAERPAQQITGNRRGEALLDAIADTDAGLDGDLARAAQGLRTLRALDQGEVARQAAVELILAPMVTAGPGGLMAEP
ncbi:hypothetical protein [Paracoccus laeviglucosivorans]|uniref:Uncharacterized protein n=1 Tax=Paracoccus laeviglucosivorans TaxID=1197861 RepID=A0A521BQD1_9RHOB|nr:hypothetical protein [Paracoccus laeviglucosivorans]SMO49372.1 hypothetical protein SAMN06265221_10358 [Paracoccus laeviglucosivorans]